MQDELDLIGELVSVKLPMIGDETTILDNLNVTQLRTEVMTIAKKAG